MAFDFTGKRMLVTGAGRGIGRGIALALAKAGCKVYALDCVQENLDKLASENAKIVTILQDLSNWDTTRATLKELEALDGLVNNAGIVRGFGPALETSKDDIDAILSVNLFAVINCTQVIGKKMIEAGKTGSIVNISSIGAILAKGDYLDYNVSKAGVDMVTKQFALELGPHNIRDKKDAVYGKITERMPIARAANIDDIVGPVLYLLSGYSSMVSGTINLVDGGLACNITTRT